MPANLPHRQSSILVTPQGEVRKETMRQVPEPDAVPSFQGLVRWNNFFLLRLFMNLELSRLPAALLMPSICIHFCRYSSGFWGTTFKDKKRCPILLRAAIQPLKDNQEEPTDLLYRSFFQPMYFLWKPSMEKNDVRITSALTGLQPSGCTHSSTGIGEQL